MEQTENMKT